VGLLEGLARFGRQRLYSSSARSRRSGIRRFCVSNVEHTTPPRSVPATSVSTTSSPLGLVLRHRKRPANLFVRRDLPRNDSNVELAPLRDIQRANPFVSAARSQQLVTLLQKSITLAPAVHGLGIEPRGDPASSSPPLLGFTAPDSPRFCSAGGRRVRGLYATLNFRDRRTFRFTKVHRQTEQLVPAINLDRKQRCPTF
jgi:hypothetical protein